LTEEPIAKQLKRATDAVFIIGAKLRKQSMFAS